MNTDDPAVLPSSSRRLKSEQDGFPVGAAAAQGGLHGRGRSVVPHEDKQPASIGRKQGQDFRQLGELHHDEDDVVTIVRLQLPDQRYRILRRFQLKGMPDDQPRF